MVIREWIWLVTLVVAVISLWHRMGQISPQRVVRYEAIRRKRAMAKAFKAEINAILDRPDDLPVDCSVYDTLVGDVGRLARDETALIVKFYQLAKQSEKVTSDELQAAGQAALGAMEAVLTRTQSRLNQLNSKFGA